jgi:hypothetical protein
MKIVAIDPKVSNVLRRHVNAVVIQFDPAPDHVRFPKLLTLLNVALELPTCKVLSAEAMNVGYRYGFALADKTPKRKKK